MTVSGAVTDVVFTASLAQVLGPTLVPGAVAMLDNVPAHIVVVLAELVEVHGARLRPHSPGFNFIELAVNKLKALPRTTQAHTRETLDSIIQGATKWIHMQGAKKMV
jgi:transposase